MSKLDLSSSQRTRQEPVDARLPAVLLIAAAVIGFVSIVLNFGPGMIAMLVLTLISFLLEGISGLRRRGAH